MTDYQSQLRVIEQRIPVTAGRITATNRNITTLQANLPALSGDAAAACQAEIANQNTSLVNLTAYLASQIARWSSASNGAGNSPQYLQGSIQPMLRSYRDESQQIIFKYGAFLMFYRPAIVDLLNRAISQIISDPAQDPATILSMNTALGYMDMTVADMQGLLNASFPIECAARIAENNTLIQHKAVPFTSWSAIKAYYDAQFGAAYVP